MAHYPYAILSDPHFHDWNAFGRVLINGENSRLRVIIDEVARAANELRAAGGDTIYLAGDIFHVRGQVHPAVLNPVLDLFSELRNAGFTVRAIPGNHDLASKESDALNNAAQALEKVGVEMVSDPMGKAWTNVLVCPWHASPSALMSKLAGIADIFGEQAKDFDCIIHAPVNGVIMGIPDHGLDPGQLAALGFRRVFAGHYHNHVEFPGGVYSIGATTHQTWSDVGTKAGFLLVHEDRVEWRESHAPKFVDVTAATDPAELPIIVDGNYVRLKLDIEKDSEVEAARQNLTDMGARGVVIHPVKKAATVSRAGTAGAGLASLSAAVGDYIKTAYAADPALTAFCEEILNATEVVA